MQIEKRCEKSTFACSSGWILKMEFYHFRMKNHENVFFETIKNTAKAQVWSIKDTHFTEESSQLDEMDRSNDNHSEHWSCSWYSQSSWDNFSLSSAIDASFYAVFNEFISVNLAVTLPFLNLITFIQEFYESHDDRQLLMNVKFHDSSPLCIVSIQ